MAAIIGFVLGNFTLTFLVIGLVFSAVALARAEKPLAAAAHSLAVIQAFALVSRPKPGARGMPRFGSPSEELL